MDNQDINISDEQTVKLIQFQDLTGIENINVCRDVLQRHGWDLEVAVQDQLNIREGRPTMFSSDHSPPAVVSDLMPQHVFSGPPANYNPGNNGWGFLGYVISVFFNLFYDTLSGVIGMTYRIFFREPRRQVTDPVGDVMRFVQNFEETYGPLHPVFYQGSYGQALSDAKQELRFLLVYLHRDNHNSCQDFCRMTLCNEVVVQYIQETNMLFWACNMNSGEGYRVAQSLHPHSTLFLAVIMLKENRMTMVARLEGAMDAGELLRRLQTVVSASEPFLTIARADRMERSFNQSLRQQQDEAYMLSLLADQEKEKQRSQVQEKKDNEAKLLREEEEAEHRRKEDLKRQKIELVHLVPEEPPVDHPQAVCVIFKLPDGSRLERRFLNSHTLEDLHHFVFCHPQSPDEFQIITNFPKRILDPTGPTKRQTLNEWGLQRGEVLFVYDLNS